MAASTSQVNQGLLCHVNGLAEQVRGAVDNFIPKLPKRKLHFAQVRLRDEYVKPREAEGVSALANKLAGVAAIVAAQVRPPEHPPADCDFNKLERYVNVVTSLPYALVGGFMWRKVKRPYMKAYAASQIAVGAAAAAYHASSGPARVWLRRLDYWAIALGSVVMTRAVFPQMPWPATAASLAATPFQPFSVSAANTTAMEVEYLKRSVKDPRLRRDHLIHCGTAAVGLGLFALDEMYPFRYPLCHAAWHGLSSASVAHTLALMQHIESHD